MNKKEELMNFIEKTNLFSRERVKPDQINSIFQALVYMVLDNYKKGIPTYIPYLGHLKIDYIKDKPVIGGVRADIQMSMVADSFIEHEICVLKKEEMNNDPEFINKKNNEELFINKIMRDKTKNLFSNKIEY